MDAKPFDMTKQHCTRDGREVTGLHRFANGYYSGIVDGSDTPFSWTPNGKAYRQGQSHIDLVNSPVQRVLYVNINPSREVEDRFFAHVYSTQEEADKMAGAERLGGEAFKLTWSE